MHGALLVNPGIGRIVPVEAAPLARSITHPPLISTKDNHWGRRLLRAGCANHCQNLTVGRRQGIDRGLWVITRLHEQCCVVGAQVRRVCPGAVWPQLSKCMVDKRLNPPFPALGVQDDSLPGLCPLDDPFDDVVFLAATRVRLGDSAELNGWRRGIAAPVTARQDGTACAGKHRAPCHDRAPFSWRPHGRSSYFDAIYTSIVLQEAHPFELFALIGVY